MKKNYINPNIEVIRIATTSMIALSGTLDPNQKITDQDGFGSREFDYDEEEE